MTTYNATLNGVNSFVIQGRTYTWDNNNFLADIDGWLGSAPQSDTVNLTLSGSWYVGAIRFPGNGLTNITDTNDGFDRTIDFLRLGDLGGTVKLTTTYVEMMTGAWNGAANITFGAAGAGGVRLGNGNDSVTTAAGFVDWLNLADGNNTIKIGSGGVDTIETRDGNDTFTLVSNSFANNVSLGGGTNKVTVGANAYIESYSGNGGSDSLTLQSGASIESVILGDGTNSLTLAAGATVNSVTGWDGNDSVTLNGDSRIFLLKLDGGNNTLTTADGNVESYYSYDGNNTLNIGTGGVQQIVLSGVGTQKITAAGFIGSLQVYDESTTTAVLNGGVISVFTGKGSDSIKIGDGAYAGNVYTWEGNDTVTAGVGSTLEFVELDVGNDVLKLNTMTAGDYTAARGGDGRDLIDFSQISTGVTISLNLKGAYQALGAGQVSLIKFENITGSKSADNLQGDGASNFIRGGGGTDIIAGLNGNDTLAGGTSNDTLTGGGGADVFEFLVGEGKDQVTDFLVGTDDLHFVGSQQLSDLAFATLGTGVLVTFGTTSVVVDNVTKADLQIASNFIFD